MSSPSEPFEPKETSLVSTARDIDDRFRPNLELAGPAGATRIKPEPGAQFPHQKIVLFFGIAASQLKDYSCDIA
jgi:hypothetical protein